MSLSNQNYDADLDRVAGVVGEIRAFVQQQEDSTDGQAIANELAAPFECQLEAQTQVALSTPMPTNLRHTSARWPSIVAEQHRGSR
jgi:hypothetical protein